MFKQYKNNSYCINKYDKHRQYESDDSDNDQNDIQEIKEDQAEQKKSEIEIILTQVETQQYKSRAEIGLFIQGQSTYNQFKTLEQTQEKQNNQLKISELIVKESEKALGDSFLDYDINNFRPDELNQIVNQQQISESDLQSLHINNKNSKVEINKLYEEFGIKIKK